MDDIPYILVHGIVVKKFLFFKPFGGICEELRRTLPADTETAQK